MLWYVLYNLLCTYLCCVHTFACIVPCTTVSEAVTDLMVNTTERSATLTATPPPVTNGIIVSYMVSYNVSGSTVIETINATNQDLMGTVESLLPFTTYVFSVRACTSVGCGPSANATATTLEDGELT